MPFNWKIINNTFYKCVFENNNIVWKCAHDIPTGIYDANGNFIKTKSFPIENKHLHTWNTNIFLKLYLKNDPYFTDESDFLTVDSLSSTGCGFYFDPEFQTLLKKITFTNHPDKNKITQINDVYIYDNRIVIIENKDYQDIKTLSYYSKKLVLSPFQLNSKPTDLLKNYIYFTLPTITVHPEMTLKGGLIQYRSTGYYPKLYEYDLISFYPNIISKFLSKDNQLHRLITPLLYDHKHLKLYVYGLAGCKYSKIYDPETVNLVTAIGREIMSDYTSRAVIIATDAIFMEYRIYPNFVELPFKVVEHNKVFVINASTYFTDTIYKGLPKDKLSDKIHEILLKILKHTQFYSTYEALLYFMCELDDFPIFPIPLKNRESITHKIDVINPIIVDKYTYVYKYRLIIYNVCNYNSFRTLNYEQFKTMYDFFRYSIN